ncbi:hypothetical protein Q8A73_001293 [Channa argus]|nr:hypothetical protein Q8A73_001293 [Channa argus]
MKWCRLGGSCGSPRSTVTIDVKANMVFTVTMSGLTTESSGWYLCVQGDLEMPVHLTVTEIARTAIFASLPPNPDNTSISGEVMSKRVGLLLLPLGLLIFIVIVTLFIWFRFKTPKQSRDESSVTMQAEGEVTYCDVKYKKENKEQDVIYSNAGNMRGTLGQMPYTESDVDVTYSSVAITKKTVKRGKVSTFYLPKKREMRSSLLQFALQPVTPSLVVWCEKHLKLSNFSLLLDHSSTDTMAVPPSYADLGKSAKDIFNKGYGFGLVKLDVKTKSASGVEFKTSGSSNTDTSKVAGSLETKYKRSEYGLTFTEKWNTDNTLGTEITIEDQIAKGLKLTFDTTFSPNTGKKSGKVKTAYKREYVNLGCDVDFDFAGPTIHGAAVVGYEGWLAGYQMSFDTAKSKMTQNNFAIGYKTGDFQLHTNV